METITDNQILAEAALYRINEEDSVAYHAFIQGAKWMRDEISFTEDRTTIKDAGWASIPQSNNESINFK